MAKSTPSTGRRYAVNRKLKHKVVAAFLETQAAATIELCEELNKLHEDTLLGREEVRESLKGMLTLVRAVGRRRSRVKLSIICRQDLHENAKNAVAEKDVTERTSIR